MTWTAPTPDPADGPLTGPGPADAGGLPRLAAHHPAQRLRRAHRRAARGERPLPSSNLSLLGLLRHAAKVERIWLRQRAAGEDVEPFYDLDLGPDHDFDHLDPADAEDAVRLLREEWLDADVAVAAMSFDDTLEVHGEEWSLRMVYVHLIAEYARHNGHADLLREALDGVTGR